MCRNYNWLIFMFADTVFIISSVEVRTEMIHSGRQTLRDLALHKLKVFNTRENTGGESGLHL